MVAIVTSAGKLVERARYSAYGIPTAFPAGDTDFDGDWDATDAADIGSNYTPGSAYAVRRDTDLDGDVDAADVTHANSITGGYQTLGRDVLTSAAVRNRIGYAGYQYDPTFAGVDRHLYHVRYRVYDAELGRWTRRDPMGYVDGVSMYEYVRSAPIDRHDACGLQIMHPWALDCVTKWFTRITDGSTHGMKCGLELRHKLQYCCNSFVPTTACPDVDLWGLADCIRSAQTHYFGCRDTTPQPAPPPPPKRPAPPRLPPGVPPAAPYFPQPMCVPPPCFVDTCNAGDTYDACLACCDITCPDANATLACQDWCAAYPRDVKPLFPVKPGKTRLPASPCSVKPPVKPSPKSLY